MSKKLRRALQVIGYAALFPVYLLGKILPKRADLFVFGSALGHHFADNAKYLILYLKQEHPEVDAIFVTRSADVLSALQNNGIRAATLKSARGVWSILRARRVFITHSTLDLHPVLIGGSEIIQLWHGTPLRKISYDADWSGVAKSNPLQNLVRRLVYTIFPYLYDAVVFDRICISAENVRPSYLTAFEISAEKTVVTGQPRNDCLVSATDPAPEFFPELDLLHRLRKESDIIAAWLPTHRAPTPLDISDLLFDYGFDQEACESLLERWNARLVLKPHFIERDALAAKLRPSNRILIYDPVDPYPLLRYSDVLLTDYSSVYFDYLLLDRPLVFTPFDKERYLRDVAGLYYDYDDVTPGPQCRNWPEVLTALDESFAVLRGHRIDPHAENRQRIRDRFNQYQERFSQRVAERFILG